MKNKDLEVAYIVKNVGQEVPENTIDVLEVGDKVTHMRDALERKQYLEKYDTNFNKGVRFVKIYDNMIDALADQLTLGEFRFAIRLTKHISYDDCILRTNGHGNGKVLTIKDISELMNLNYQNCCKLMNSLIDKGVFGKHTVGSIETPGKELQCYTANPYIFMRGMKVERAIVALFEDTGWGRIRTTETEESN